jgi:hypothetical protein
MPDSAEVCGCNGVNKGTIWEKACSLWKGQNTPKTSLLRLLHWAWSGRIDVHRRWRLLGGHES